MAGMVCNKDFRCLVAVDVAKYHHVALIEHHEGGKKKMRIANERCGFEQLLGALKVQPEHCCVAFEPTADYHRTLAYFFKTHGVEVRLVSSLALARTREALHNSWDKNDPKDAQVMLHLLKGGHTCFYHDPVIQGTNDWQELAKTYFQVALRKTRLQHSLLNHYLPIYFPEAERFMVSHRAQWFARMLMHYPTPSSITSLGKEAFIARATPLCRGKRRSALLLGELYEVAQGSVGVPVPHSSQAVAMLKLVAQDYLQALVQRQALEARAEKTLAEHPDFVLLRTIPGVGPIVALNVLAEAGNLRRFAHEKQFLKFCGLDLSTQQSGTMRGRTMLSKRGNARLRAMFWMAARVAVRQRENGFARKFRRYTSRAPEDCDLKRRAYTATAAKMARVAYHVVRSEQVYRPLYEETITRRRNPLNLAVEARTS